MGTRRMRYGRTRSKATPVYLGSSLVWECFYYAGRHAVLYLEKYRFHKSFGDPTETANKPLIFDAHPVQFMLYLMSIRTSLDERRFYGPEEYAGGNPSTRLYHNKHVNA